jgi:hypothetical protein
MITRRVSKVALLGILAGAGCSAGSDQYADPFPRDTGRAPGATAATYSAGPYGLSVGSTIADISFQGFPQLVSEASPSADDSLQLRMSDFYNPTMDGRWSADSPFGEAHALVGASSADKTFSTTGNSAARWKAGDKVLVRDSTANDGTYTVASATFSDPNTVVTVSEAVPSDTGDGQLYGDRAKPAAVFVIGSAEWCGPCQYEAQTIIPESHAIYAAGQCGNGTCGAGEDHDSCVADCPNPGDNSGYDHTGEFVLALQEGQVGYFSGSARPAEMEDVLDWSGQFALDYPAVADPHYKLFQYTGQGAFPGILLVRTRDMKIINIHVGGLYSAADDVWADFQDVLNDNPVLPADFD